MADDHHHKLWELSDAILSLENKDEVQRFFADLGYVRGKKATPLLASQITAKFVT